MSPPPADEANTSTVAAVDLGSNSFHMVVAHVADGQVHIVDRLKESVRLAAGLDDQQGLTPEARERALACLERFGQRLRLLPAGRVRAVGTNTLRRARPLGSFLDAAERALGHPIEVIYGQEEARLIYSGVTLDLGDEQPRRLVVDIGGGSTEIVIGHGRQPQLLESLSLGAVSHSQQYFPEGVISKSAWNKAVVDARVRLEPLIRQYRETGWDAALGASGSIKAIQRVCIAAGWTDNTITREALGKLSRKLIKSGDINAAKLPKLDEDRRPIFPGAAAVLTAIFNGLSVAEMGVSDKALREGLLLDLMDRDDNRDIREVSIVDIQRRYQLDTKHAERVADTTRRLLHEAGRGLPVARESERLLHWAAQLHEIGLAIAHKGYHKHGAYIVRNADLQGFSQSEQAALAALLHLHRGKFRPSVLDDLPNSRRTVIEPLALVLRLAVLLHRGRDPDMQPPVHLRVDGKTLTLSFDDDWGEAHPLTQADLVREQAYLKAVGHVLRLSD